MALLVPHLWSPGGVVLLLLCGRVKLLPVQEIASFERRAVVMQGYRHSRDVRVFFTNL